MTEQRHCNLVQRINFVILKINEIIGRYSHVIQLSLFLAVVILPEAHVVFGTDGQSKL